MLFNEKFHRDAVPQAGDVCVGLPSSRACAIETGSLDSQDRLTPTAASTILASLDYCFSSFVIVFTPPASVAVNTTLPGPQGIKQ